MKNEDSLCNCDNGGAYTHHAWCEIYRPEGTSQSDWEAALEKHYARLDQVGCAEDRGEDQLRRIPSYPPDCATCDGGGCGDCA